MHSVSVITDEDVLLAGLEWTLSATMTVGTDPRPCLTVLAPSRSDLPALTAQTRRAARSGSVVVWLLDRIDRTRRQAADDLGAVPLLRTLPRHQLAAAVLTAAGRPHQRLCLVTPVSAEPVRLSVREREVLRRYARGETAVQVARATGLSADSIPTYVRRVRAKYAIVGRPAPTRVDLFHRAQEDGLLTDPDPRAQTG